MRRRALVISVLAGLALSGCEPESRQHEPALPDRFEDKLVLLDLLRGGEYDALEARLTIMQGAFEAAEVSEASVESAFRAFINNDAAVRRGLGQWIGAMPDSYAARLARAYNHWQRGWHSRGHKPAAATAPERFAAMAEAFEDARADLTEAIAVNAKLTAAHALLIDSAMTQGRRGEVNETARAGLAQVPHSFSIREAVLASKRPWWGGSLPEINAYVALTITSFPAMRPCSRLRATFISCSHASSIGNSDLRSRSPSSTKPCGTVTTGNTIIGAARRTTTATTTMQRWRTTTARPHAIRRQRTCSMIVVDCITGADASTKRSPIWTWPSRWRRWTPIRASPAPSCWRVWTATPRPETTTMSQQSMAATMFACSTTAARLPVPSAE